MSKKDPNLLKTKVKRSFAFKLTDADRAAMMIKTAAWDAEIEELEAKKKEANAEFNSKINALHEKRQVLSKAVREGEEQRTVDATEERDYAADQVRYTFEGKVLEERPMSIEERQKPLAIKPPKKGPKRRFPGNGKDAADFKKAAAGDKDDDDLAAHIRQETNSKTKHSAVDGPTKGSA